MNKSGLIFRLAISVGFASLLVGFISAQLFYRFTYQDELHGINDEVQNLYKTVSPTAAIAAYLNDEGLAAEVVNGLATNNSVKAVAFKNEQLNVSSGETFALEQALLFEIHSPFQPERVSGRLYIEPDLEFIKAQANELALANVEALSLLALVVTFASLFIAYLLLTKPMSVVASRLTNITPGSGQRLTLPQFHTGSELGTLVRDVNALLDKTDEQFSTERSLRNELEVHEKRFRMLFEHSIAPTVLMEPTGSILLFNSAFEKLLVAMDIRVSRNFGPFLQELFEQPKVLAKTVKNALANEEVASGEFKLKTHHGRDIWVQAIIMATQSDEQREYYQVTLFDISKRKSEMERLNRQAHYDPLTHLMNRRAMEKELEKLISQQAPFALMVMDLNGFKPINDIYGHDCGDEILVHVAGQLGRCLKVGDLVARWGGDEFVLVLKDATNDSVHQFSNKLIKYIKKPYFLRDHKENVVVGASLGVAFYPTDDISFQGLLRLADKAMYMVKGSKGSDDEIYLKIVNEIQGQDYA